MIDLLSCPLCQSDDHTYITKLDDEDDRRHWFCIVGCDMCDLKLKRGISWREYRELGENAELRVQEMTAKAWNTRAKDTVTEQNIINEAFEIAADFADSQIYYDSEVNRVLSYDAGTIADGIRALKG